MDKYDISQMDEGIVKLIFEKGFDAGYVEGYLVGQYDASEGRTRANEIHRDDKFFEEFMSKIKG